MTVSQWRQFSFFDREQVVDAEEPDKPPSWLQDDDSGVPIIKVWNLEKADKTAKTPVLMRSSKVQHGNKVFPVTAVAVLKNLTQVAVGLENGIVLLFRGDMLRDKFTKPRVVHEGSETITGLGFYEDGKSTTLFIVTLAKILSCVTSNKDVLQTLDEQGADFGNSILTPQELNQEMVIGRTEAIYFYGLDGRGPCFIIDDLGPGREGSPGEGSPPAFGAEGAAGTVLTLYDLKNKFVAYSGTFGTSEGGSPKAIKSVLGEWGELFVITDDKKMYRLEEKDLDTKLDILFKKNMYALAINLVTSSSVPPSSNPQPQEPSIDFDYGTVVEIYKRYGDWLYSKTEYDMAMQQYLRTVGQLEPSYVIRKFLDAQRIHNLTSYLQALHERGLANADHTTLLLNCYTKLKDEKRLDRFIKTADSGTEISFDMETAIRVCRQGGYYDHALYLAKRHGRHKWVLTILVEDVTRYGESVEYIVRLDNAEAEDELKRYGPILVKEAPGDTTDVLVGLCGTVKGAAPEDFIHLYVEQRQWCIEFLERVVERRWGEGKGKGKAGTPLPTPTLDDFERERELTSRKIVSNTLLELYLDGGTHIEDGVRSITASWREKIMNLLQDDAANYDMDQALVLCKTHMFKEGILYLYERMRLHKDILQFQMDEQDPKAIIATCKRYGDADSTLWTTALTYFAEKGTHPSATLGPDQCPPELLEVLNTIDKRNLLPPLQVVQVLSKNASVTIGMVRGYLTRRLEAERKAIDESEKLIKSYRDETDRMRSQIEELKSSPIVFQATKCELCRQQLELPTVHFMCRHSFHQRCLGESDGECPRCAPEHRIIQELVRGQEQSAGKHDVFLQKLQGAEDRFSVIADYFSKNTFVTLKPVD
ncbi:Vacuolar protein sorting-associated protein 11 [Rhizophlyctis rosea]|uniref:E3 ubiquitin-protein ligase PEP5 n=1 Tax=Rhizophlyctis rosea TaxID=64517 RepID=A0AAD5SB79_9FUNG|nr:Vacuolar protein sorting-associated protein 11 [Rhizophlyctis rosea]